MNQRQFAALDDYFDALLEDPAPQPAAEPERPAVAYADPEEEERRRALESLLATVAELKEEEAAAVEPEVMARPAPLAEPVIKATPKVSTPEVVPEIQADTQVEPQVETQVSAEPAWRNMDTEPRFQALFFEVAGMTFAVPLTHLGGIYQISKLTSLFGKPAWFAGIMTERERQLSVVDTARWAMPGHTQDEEYQYVVTLGESHWGLSCHQLKGTAQLTREQVKWRTTPGSRPWLAGMVKEKMCALLHVDALIALLEQGKNIDGQRV
ncbi:chemotaxis protein CheW [Oceanimonas sp. CHS3-5]|uniref:chemotaxis protein CheW n=1 Tax=Oceanimonas sp. CHS3-5 TaxID=3068186 RepID=UPI00273EDC5F|nr:chemotaxis protein CheW [Oceanimonas sp. CHS3-5]MDP5290736.1 chemotaxis protein CheW [Oceanimonas sp. CHS3-5]